MIFFSDDIWNNLAVAGKARTFPLSDLFWRQLLNEAKQEGVVLERRKLRSGVCAIYLRRRSQK